MSFYVKNSLLIVGLIFCLSVIYSLHLKKINGVDSIKEKYSLMTYYSYRLVLLFMLFTLSYVGLEKAFSLLSPDGNITKVQETLIVVLSVSFAIFLDIKIKSPMKSHLICPNCLKSVAVIQDWQCPYCNNINEHTNITTKCKNCNDLLPGFVCPYCQEDIGFDDSYNEKELKRRRHEQV